MSARGWMIAALVATLAGCAARPVRAPLPQDQLTLAESQQQAREVALRREQAWSLAGRIAVSNGRNGGSGRLEWTQDGPRYTVALSAPVTRQSWQLSGDGAQARLEGLEGGPRTGADAEALLLEATGWQIPVAALNDWVRGVRAEGLGPATMQYGESGRLARIEQGGWGIDYEWPQVADAAPAPVLPSRLDARRGEARLRLIVDQWSR